MYCPGVQCIDPNVVLFLDIEQRYLPACKAHGKFKQLFSLLRCSWGAAVQAVELPVPAATEHTLAPSAEPACLLPLLPAGRVSE